MPASLIDAPRLPTVRDVALRRRESGAGGLPDAEQRGDGAAYQEVVCRSALNRVQGMPFAWTLNPYRGCTHGCHYCFARRYQSQLEMDAGGEFSSVILVKVNFPEVLRRELIRKPRAGERAAFGTATDPYQPIEGSYRLTRRALEALVERPMRVDLVTRGPLIVRDMDLLTELSRTAACTVSFSVPTTDEEAWRRLEPGTAHPLQRLRALAKLAAAGVDAGVLMAPIVPGISSAPAKLEATVRAVADHGARFVGGGLLHLDGGARAHFLEFLDREYPELSAGYRRLYAGKHPAPRYAEQVLAMLGGLQARYGLARRQGRRPEAAAPADGRPPQPPLRQRRFDWRDRRTTPAGPAVRSAARSAGGC